nr:hillarin-like [Halyomorpha halys]
MYRVNFYESTCLRCDQTVYQVDRVGPLKDFTFFHSGCFKCAVCGTKLTLKTYYNNQHRQEDKEVYCSGHVPKIGPGHLDGSAVGIRSALNVPKTSLFVNEQIRSTNGSTVAPAPQLDQYQYGRFDASALHIAHALRATEIHRAYNKAREKPIEYYLDKDEQTQLEMKHRKEEDDLYRKFIRQREEEDKRIKDEIRVR